MTLTCIAVVCRELPAIDALDHVVQMLDDLLDHSQRWSIPDAAGAGHLHLLQRLAVTTSNPDSTPVVGKKLLRSAMRRAAENGHLHVMHSLRASFSPELELDIARGTLSKAVAAGHVEVAHWVDTNYPEEPCEAMAIISAVRGGHLSMIQWVVRRRRLEWIVAVAFFDPLVEAVTRGQLCIVQWICRWTMVPRDFERLVVIAQCHGHAHIAEWFASFEPRQSALLPSQSAKQSGSKHPHNRCGVANGASARLTTVTL
jgi:hypothetical protein